MRTPANLKKRLLTGSAMTIAIAGVIFGDEYLVTHSQFLYVCVISLAFLASYELRSLISVGKPRLVIVWPVLWLLVTGEWIRNTDWKTTMDLFPTPGVISADLVAVSAVAIAITVVVEIFCYSGDGQSWPRVGNTAMTVLYLGMLPLFLIKLRTSHFVNGMFAFIATIFVPKLGDVGAYFTGSLIGKHKMTPTLSPKKTWEGFAGGLVVSVLTAIVINAIPSEPLFKHGMWEAIAFGIVVGIAGVLGDLFESMLKRDAQAKDAAQSLPGFGGVLDVVDSVLFAAPVAYLFFMIA